MKITESTLTVPPSIDCIMIWAFETSTNTLTIRIRQRWVMVRSDFYRFASTDVCQYQSFCVATHVAHTDIRNAQSCCERPASADVK